MHIKLWYLIFIIFFTNTNFIVKINAEGKNNGFIQRKLGIYISDRPKNILVGSVIGGGSHLNPMLEICKILEDRGYKVTLAAPGNFTAKSTLYHSIPQIITGERRDTYKLPGYNKAFFNKYTFKNLVDSRKDTNERYIKTFNKYLQAYKETNADLLFCDYSANEACFDLAWKLKKPVIGFASATILLLRIPSYLINDELYLNSQRAEVGVNKHDDFRGRITNTLFLIDTFFGFEISSAWNPIHQEIGPILPDTYPGLSSDLELFLSTHPRTMYIALGTYVYTTTNNYVTLLQSALELINHNILDGVIWATVKFNESELPSTFTLSTGDVIPTSNLLDNLYPHIHITKFAPQFAILSHENTKVFLSHGGIGSSHESMYTATPMLVLPIAFDQPGNAERLELAGMALKLSKLDLKIDDIESKYSGADLIEIVMNLAEREGVRNENNELEVDNDVLLRHWITPDSRMGLIRGKYLDVFGAAVIIGITLIDGFGYGFYKIIRFAFKRLFSKAI
ncbi:22204_t:CDS:2 [Gigaspora margarita]|uniref:22204_t:CDS:1 n=1 Tax=Gigaspora margarita TaxID=4874 RepID=A0ABM8VWG3_GIGMA|nr:22204_t:CDS:2 [Gigaspora margarita]